jgi:hypothetical protein
MESGDDGPLRRRKVNAHSQWTLRDELSSAIISTQEARDTTLLHDNKIKAAPAVADVYAGLPRMKSIEQKM